MLAIIMLCKMLVLILLQGVLTSEALVPAQVHPGDLPNSPASRPGSSRASGSGDLPNAPGTRPGSSGASGPESPAGSLLSEATEAKSRSKRCTCYSYKDKECVYYCHLDIIWINTPEHTVPYGMSSYRGAQRIRRALSGQATKHEEAKTPRCVCAVLNTDPECHDFCMSSPLQTVPCRSLHRIPGPG